MKTATELADASMMLTAAQDREAWLDVYTPDAIFRDPVGPSPHDPEGKGYRGRAEMGRLFDTVIAKFKSVHFVVRERYSGGDLESASVFTVIIRDEHDHEHILNGMAVHVTDGSGKLTAASSYLVPGGSKLCPTNLSWSAGQPAA